MNPTLKQFKQLIVTVMLQLIIIPAIAQVKHITVSPVKHAKSSARLKDFFHLAADANVNFIYPHGFKEISAPDNEDFSFDYALELPGKEFEIWFKIKSEKQDWTSYQHALNSPNAQLANPDSLYKESAAAMASTLTDDKNYFIRTIPPNVLVRYNADAGKSYLLTLRDLPDTKHYKYALLITLQKNHTGTIMAVCFTNVKGPEFFKNIDKASNCLKFKPTNVDKLAE